MRRLGRVGRFGRVAVVATIVTAVGIVSDPMGVAAAGNVYGTWAVSGANPSWTGTLTVAPVGFPNATLATNSNTPTTPMAAFLNAATPFGAVFGSSSGSNYLSAAAAAGGVPSTTTLTFAEPTPATGWGFAFGDIDADQIQIQANGPAGPLSVAQLGFQGVFNYCTPTTPRPASCGGAAQADVPTWDATTATLIGNGVDTAGASGWFRPTMPITSITLTFSVLVGIPNFQTWLAAATSDIFGSVAVDDGAPTPPGTTLNLLDRDGTVLATTTVGADGSYSFLGVASTDYTVAATPPDGYEIVGPEELDVDATAGDVTGVDFVLQLTPPDTTTTTTTTSPTTTTTSPTTTTVDPSTTTVDPSTTTVDPSTTTSTNVGAVSTTSIVAAATSTTPAAGILPATGNTSTGTYLAFATMLTSGGLAVVLLARRAA